MKKFFRKGRYYFITLAIVVIGAITISFSDNDFKIVKNLDIYYSLFREISMYYVDETDPEKLVKSSIEGMLEKLDPYTTFIDESELDEYNFMTTGKYGGIGAIVRKSANSIIIVEPYENSPAQKSGLKAGDVVYEVNGQAINGKEMDDISELLKGDPGTKAVLTVERANSGKHIKISVVREKISISSVMYAGIIRKNIGYMKITGFTEGTSIDAKNAFLNLKAQGAESLIIDLRDNPGGLLGEAVGVVNLFVDKNQVIVSTHGKLSQYNSSYRTTNNPVDTKIPIVVLVSHGSASASEIVAGSLQDLDRAVVVGQRTFGKGLVQATRPLCYNTKLKITTAKYYIPSGRCIQAIDYTHRNADGNAGKVPDSLIREFKTLNGRSVFDGGGVMPDIYIQPEIFSKVGFELYSKYYIFDFATLFYSKTDSIKNPEQFEISNDVYSDFKNYLKERKFNFRTASEDAFEKLIAATQKEKYSESAKPELEALKQKISHNKNLDLDKNRNEIVQLLKEEIVSRYYFQKGKVRASLIGDTLVNTALKIITDTKYYNDIITGKIKNSRNPDANEILSDFLMEEE
jgi:carboxyl-terminal processing protease